MKLFKKGLALCLAMGFMLASSVTAHAMDFSWIKDTVKYAVENDSDQYVKARTDVLTPVEKNIQKISISEDIGNIHVLPSTDGKLKLEAEITVKSKKAGVVDEALKSIEAGYEFKNNKLEFNIYLAGTKTKASGTFNQTYTNASERYNSRGGNYQNTYYSVKHTLYVPAASSYKYELITDVGDIYISNIKGSFEAKTDVGDIEVSQVDGKEIDLESDVGKITVDSSSGAFDIAVDVGNIELNDIKITGDSEFETNIGKITGSIQSVSNAKAIKIETEIGKIDMQLSSSINCEIEKKQGGHKTVTETKGKGGATIKMKTETGSIHYNFG